jgi:DNA/RNA-binding domain of Phe-tRNA-synthetase-like protein
MPVTKRKTSEKPRVSKAAAARAEEAAVVAEIEAWCKAFDAKLDALNAWQDAMLKRLDRPPSFADVDALVDNRVACQVGL